MSMQNSCTVYYSDGGWSNTYYCTKCPWSTTVTDDYLGEAERRYREHLDMCEEIQRLKNPPRKTTLADHYPPGYSPE